MLASIPSTGEIVALLTLILKVVGLLLIKMIAVILLSGNNCLLMRRKGSLCVGHADVLLDVVRFLIYIDISGIVVVIEKRK